MRAMIMNLVRTQFSIYIKMFFVLCLNIKRNRESKQKLLQNNEKIQRVNYPTFN
jgi:hypothetical protein